MRQGDVERWVVRVVDQVDRGLRVEDDRVECKSKLIEPAKAARRIAGHANQVREDRILWIIGVDEARKPPVVGIEAGGPDPAEWWAQVESKFQDVAPSLTLVNVPISSDKSVLGLGFDTSRPPYVLKVASGEVNREVPWREGTRVRSANRVDLLKLLVPLAERPQVSVLDGWLEVVSDASSKELSWHGEIDLYVDCQAPVVFPDHRCAGRAVFDSGYETEFVVTPGAAIATAPSPSGVLLAAPSSPSALMAEQSCKQVVVRGSSPIWLTVRGSTNDDLTRYVLGDGRLDIELGTGGVDPFTIQLSPVLAPVPAEARGPNRLAKWALSSSH